MKILILLSLGVWTLISQASHAIARDTIRVGHFPNMTHVQGLVAQHLSRTGHGWFEHERHGAATVRTHDSGGAGYKREVR